MAARHAGFGLNEALVVLAVVAILAMVAVPSMGSLMAGKELQRAEETLAGLLRQARVEARLRASLVTVRLRAGSSVVSMSSADGTLNRAYTLDGVVAAADSALTFLPSGIVRGAGQLDLRSSRPGGPSGSLLIVSAVGQVRVQ